MATSMTTMVAQPTTGYSVPVVTRTEATAVTAVTATIETVADVSDRPIRFLAEGFPISAANNDPTPGGDDVTTVLAAFGGLTGDGLTTTVITGLTPNECVC